MEDSFCVFLQKMFININIINRIKERSRQQHKRSHTLAANLGVEGGSTVFKTLIVVDELLSR